MHLAERAFGSTCLHLTPPPSGTFHGVIPGNDRLWKLAAASLLLSTQFQLSFDNLARWCLKFITVQHYEGLAVTMDSLYPQ